MIDLESLSLEQASLLPLKLQWGLVHFWRDSDDYSRAESLVEQIEAQRGESSNSLNEKTRLALAKGDAIAAREFAVRRQQIAPSATAEIELGRCELAISNYTKARSIAEENLARNPQMQTAVTFAAEVDIAEGELDSAERHFRSLLDTNERSVVALLGLVRVSLLRDDRLEASRLLAELTAEPSSLSAAQCRLAAKTLSILGNTGMSAGLMTRADAMRKAVTDQIRADVSQRLSDLPALDRAEVPTVPLTAVDAETTEPDLEPSIVDALRSVFGFSSLRPGQARVVANVMAGQDTLAIMPTGSGKSLTFQLPALLHSGVTLVISPLIALMKDQVESLPPELRDKTRLINSTLSADEMRSALADLAGGSLKLIYIAPERLRDRAFLQAMRSATVALVVVDEAHCISLWGQDFRPDYLFIPRAVAEMGQPPVLAVTATATPAMAEQIATGLGRAMDQVRLSLFRPNLHYEVRRQGSRDLKIRDVLGICRSERGSGIVYVTSRKDTESIAALLRDNGVSAIAYHAGLEPALRAASQDRFMSGRVRVVVATIAFGMGVDKANVRFIVHFNPPSSLEAYGQESGRAGRDGQPARCVLMAGPNDETRMRRFARGDALTKDDLRTVYANLKRFAAGRWVLLDRVAADRLSGDEEINSRVALGLLEQAGLIARHPDVPSTLSLRWNPQLDTPQETDPAWRSLLSWLGPGSSRGTATIVVTEACTALNLAPLELDRLLSTHPGVRVQEGPRMVCIELLPADAGASERIDQILTEMEALSDRRIRQVLAYAQRRTCRHVMLAAQFGERLEACSTSCDVCKGEVANADRPANADGKRRDPGADEALSVLSAMKSLPYSMGRTGLVRLLTGSAESRLQKDRALSFGLMSDFSVSAIGKLVDRLVELGFLFRDADHEYKLITLTETGRSAKKEELNNQFVASSSGGRRTASDASSEAVQLSEEDRRLFDRLRLWRQETASAENVPAYVIAHNTMLETVALHKPRTISQLASLPGFGPVKCEKYGGAILTAIDQHNIPEPTA
ncbi:hypothetical protein BH23CHL5_BH23CHL5_24370 [soil metagenome]